MLGRKSFALTCAALSISTAAVAQDKQTAAGAQKFLAVLASDNMLYVGLMDGAGVVLPISGTLHRKWRWIKDGVETGGGPLEDYVAPLQGWLSSLLGAQLDSTDRSGNVNACVTRIAKTIVSAKDSKLGGVTTSDATKEVDSFFGSSTRLYRQTNTEVYEDPSVKFAGPYYIEWGRAAVTRSADGRIVASTPNGAFTAQLIYAGKDADMADRVEYAMKFLKASCDKAAATGF